MATIVNKNRLNQEKEQSQGGQPQANQRVLTTAANVGATGTPATGGAQAPVSNKSGNFSNVSSFLAANKQAGQNILNRVNQGIQTQTTKNFGEANKNVDAFRSAVQNVQGVGTQAQGFQNLMAQPQLPTATATEAANQLAVESGNTTFLTPTQTPIAAPSPGQVAALPIGTPKLSGTNQTIEQTPVQNTVQAPRELTELEKLAADQNQFNLYKDVATGTALSSGQKSITDTGTQANQTAMNALQKIQDRQTQLTKQDKRETLLQDFLKGNVNNYNRGLMGLDKTFLSSEQKGLDTLKKDLNRTRAEQSKAFNTTLDEQTNLGVAAIDNLRSFSGEQGSLLNTARGNEQEFAKAVAAEDRITEVNRLRTEAQSNLSGMFKELQEGKAVDQRLIDLYGLEEGQRLFNVFKNAQNTGDQIDFTELDKTTYNRADQLATADERSRYNALAQLAMINPTAMQILQESQALDGNKFISSGEQSRSSLNERLDESKDKLTQDLQQFLYNRDFGSANTRNITNENFGKEFSEFVLNDSNALSQLENVIKNNNDKYYYNNSFNIDNPNLALRELGNVSSNLQGYGLTQEEINPLLSLLNNSITSGVDTMTTDKGTEGFRLLQLLNILNDAKNTGTFNRVQKK